MVPTNNMGGKREGEEESWFIRSISKPTKPRDTHPREADAAGSFCYHDVFKSRTLGRFPRQQLLPPTGLGAESRLLTRLTPAPASTGEGRRKRSPDRRLPATRNAGFEAPGSEEESPW